MTTETATTYENVLYEVKDRVAIITWNRPENLNAISFGLKTDLGSALQRADADPNVGCIVITGAGRAFSAGADLKQANNPDDRRPPGAPRTPTPGSRDVSKLVIVAVNGLCFGAALIWLVQQDITIVSDRSRFCYIESRFGAEVGMHSPFLIGPQWAKLMICAGEEISAQTASRIGLITEVVPHEELMTRVLDLAHRVATMPLKGVIASKSEIDGTMDTMGYSDTYALGKRMLPMRDGVSDSAVGPDGRSLNEIRKQDGMKAFIEARDVAWGTRWVQD